VGFVDNPDTDTSPGQQVISNKGLAYAYMLTLPMRQALIYGKDYFPNSVWPGAYGLKPLIDNLCWISRMFAFGKYQVRYADNDVHIASRDGDGGKTGWSGGLLTALNFNTLSARTIACSTPFGPHRWLHDYTGHHPDVWSDGSGNATFTIPANSYARGQSYLCFAPGGVNGPVVRAPQTTTQTFIASADLDILPARNSAQLLPQRIFCAANSDIVLQLSAQLPAGGSLSARVVAPDGSSVAEQRIGAGAIERRGHTVQRGWHAISVVGADLPSEGANFALTLTYMGAKQ